MTAAAGVCPSCGFAQNPSNPTCLKCKAPLAGIDAPVGAASISREGWRALGLGLLLAAVLTAIPFFLILFHDVDFAWSLAHSEDFRDWYAEGKGGMLNDFTRVNLYVRSWTVPVLGRYLLMGCGCTVAAAWLAHRYQDAIAGWWDRAVK